MLIYPINNIKNNEKDIIIRLFEFYQSLLKYFENTGIGKFGCNRLLLGMYKFQCVLQYKVNNRTLLYV